MDGLTCEIDTTNDPSPSVIPVIYQGLGFILEFKTGPVIFCSTLNSLLSIKTLVE